MLLTGHICARVRLLLAAVPCSVALACTSPGENLGRWLDVTSQGDAEAAAATTETDFLFISGDVTDLSPLSSLTSVRIGVYVQSTTELRSLHGLENVRDPGLAPPPALYVRIEDNAALDDVSALQMPRASGIELVGGNTALLHVELSTVELDYLLVENEQTVAAVRSSTLEIINQSIEVSNVPQLCTVELPALRVLAGNIETHYEVCWPEEEQQALLEQAGDGS